MHSKYEIIIYRYIAPVFLFFGLLKALFLLHLSKRIKARAFYVYKILQFLDFLIIILYMCFIGSKFYALGITYKYFNFHNYFLSPVLNSSIALATLILLYITVKQYVAIKHPMHFQKLERIDNFFCLKLLLFFAFILVLHFPMEFKYTRLANCFNNATLRVLYEFRFKGAYPGRVKAYTIFIQLLFNLFPFVAFCIFVVLLIRQVNAMEKKKFVSHTTCIDPRPQTSFEASSIMRTESNLTKLKNIKTLQILFLLQSIICRPLMAISIILIPFNRGNVLLVAVANLLELSFYCINLHIFLIYKPLRWEMLKFISKIKDVGH